MLSQVSNCVQDFLIPNLDMYESLENTHQYFRIDMDPLAIQQHTVNPRIHYNHHWTLSIQRALANQKDIHHHMGHLKTGFKWRASLEMIEVEILVIKTHE